MIKYPKMKPCPFCGGNRLQHFIYPYQKPGIQGCFVACMECGARSGKYETIEEAREAWNTRERGNEK